MEWKKIWKFVLDPAHPGLQNIAMPEGATVLSVAPQDDKPVVYAACDPRCPLVPRTFWVLMTGQQFVPTGSVFIGTTMFIDDYGEYFVLHIFEVHDRCSSEEKPISEPTRLPASGTTARTTPKTRKQE